MIVASAIEPLIIQQLERIHILLEAANFSQPASELTNRPSGMFQLAICLALIGARLHT